MRQLGALLLGAGLLLYATGAAAQGELRQGGKLLLTQGISSLDGAAGGGLTPWAIIAGYETRDGVGANVHATGVQLRDFQLRSFGAAVGFRDRVELSYAHQDFDTQGAGAKLGLGRGFTFGQDIVGAKLRLAGDAVYDQDRWLPQIAVGAQYKRADQGAVLGLLGARGRSGVDGYVSATKLFLDQSLLLNGTVRATRANQTGLLGFGGPADNGYHVAFEGSAALLLNRRLAIGAEYRSKPDNLGLREDDFADLFAAFAVNKALSVTAAYVRLGEIATFPRQDGLFLSLQAGF